MIDRRLVIGALAAMTASPAAAEPRSVFEFRVPRLEGGEHDLAGWRGRVLLVVNTASFCGYTPQFEGLQRLHARFEARGLTVLGAPSNDFNQESGDERRIRELCELTYGVAFPMTGLQRVRGAEAHPLFRFLAARGGGEPRWNFHKYLVARDGRRVQGFPTRVTPDAPDLLRAIEAALAASPEPPA